MERGSNDVRTNVDAIGGVCGALALSAQSQDSGPRIPIPWVPALRIPSLRIRDSADSGSSNSAFSNSNSGNSNFGFSLPVTLSGGAMYTGRLQFENPGNSPVTAGFQAMLYPTLTLGKHWFAYAAEQIRLSPYVYYDAYDPDHEWYIQTIQAFLGYQIRGEKTTVVFKVGRLVLRVRRVSAAL